MKTEEFAPFHLYNMQNKEKYQTSVAVVADDLYDLDMEIQALHVVNTNMTQSNYCNTHGVCTSNNCTAHQYSCGACTVCSQC